MSEAARLPQGTAIAVLAAGSGVRFGSDKLRAKCAGRPLAEWSIAAALGLGVPVAVVTCSERPLATANYDERIVLLVNQHSRSGLGSSVTLAARWSLKCGYRRLILMLADMPLVSQSTLAELAHKAAERLKSACLYPDGGAGVPACFDAVLLERLAATSLPTGAKEMLRRLDDSCLVKPDPAELIDIDTPGDLISAEKLLLITAALHHERA